MRPRRLALAFACFVALWTAPWPARAADDGPGYRLSVEGPLEPADRVRLEREIARAVAAFRAHVGPQDHPVVVRVGGGALATGYSAERDEVGFPENGKLIAAGVRSQDVVHHELFHAMASQFPAARAAALGDEDQRALHEAIADFFAHALSPDDLFGEDYYAGEPHVRRYREGLCWALARGAHAKGGALCEHLLDHGYTLADLGRFLRGPFTREALLALRGGASTCFAAAGAPAVDVTPRNYPPSMLQKFVLDPARPLELAFTANAEFARLGALDVTFGDGVACVTLERVPDPSAVVWRLTGVPGTKPAKVIALYRAGGKVVGFLPLYFRVK